ncbi:MAG: hydantoinase B/oxoprolinase family protein [Nitrospinota bacterium]|nr:MAG: hydantoinase B/oxoprolinase family protein [Nitrospinota bacterium]
MSYDPIKLEVFKNLFASVAEEMGVTLCRTAYSPNIKERRDYSCAVFDGQGRMVAQGDHMPVHLGSMPLSVLSAIENVPMEPGDVVVLNDPYKGGTHLPDITLVSPVYEPGTTEPLFFVANRAHHADVGGMTPGSMPLSTEVFQEGIRIPPLKLMRKGEVVQDVMSLILANVRTPEEREGDLTAQLAANKTGERRLLEIVAKYGRAETVHYMQELQKYAERMTRAAIASIPDGTYTFVDYMDDDGISPDPVKIHVVITIEGSNATIDFSGSARQVRGSINAIYAITLSAVFYVFRSLVGSDIPSNYGGMVPLTVIAPEGTVVNATFPAAVAGGNVETSQRMVDVLLGALAQALPDRVPAASSGTMNNVTIGGYDPRKQANFTYYETIGGGMGARPNAPGIDGVHTHMTNTMNTPIEALEHAYPFRVLRYGIRRGSGGKGKFRGGDGIIREWEILVDGEVTILSERRKLPPYGLAGGEPGQVGENLLQTKTGSKRLPSKVNIRVEAGDILRVATPGGGGYGKAEE